MIMEWSYRRIECNLLPFEYIVPSLRGTK
jgi:hypothetical protein